MTVTISQGLPEPLRARAAAIYWQAFGGKLGRVLGPEDRAERFLTRVMRADHCFVARNLSGDLVGVAGFKTPQGAFAGGGTADLTAEYGLAGGMWRAGVLRLLSRDIDNDRFLIDGICVARGARSQGIGTALLAALCDEARARGYRSVRLDVVDTNFRARALYERLGFMAVDSQPLGPLRHVFGFSAATTMVRVLD